MRWLFLVLLQLVRINSHFLVQLSSSIAPFDFLKEYPSIESCVDRTYTFGSFHGFSGNFGLDMVKFLGGHAYVVGISPDITIRATEIQREAPRHLSRISQRKKLPHRKCVN
jgi:hypothetical protein